MGDVSTDDYEACYEKVKADPDCEGSDGSFYIYNGSTCSCCKSGYSYEASANHKFYEITNDDSSSSTQPFTYIKDGSCLPKLDFAEVNSNNPQECYDLIKEDSRCMDGGGGAFHVYQDTSGKGACACCYKKKTEEGYSFSESVWNKYYELTNVADQTDTDGDDQTTDTDDTARIASETILA